MLLKKIRLQLEIKISVFSNVVLNNLSLGRVGRGDFKSPKFLIFVFIFIKSKKIIIFSRIEQCVFLNSSKKNLAILIEEFKCFDGKFYEY